MNNRDKERDIVWSKAIIRTLNLDDAARVFAEFNKIRPDATNDIIETRSKTKMKKFYVSKTVIVGALVILSAVLLFVSDFVATGDYSLPSILLGVNGVVMIFLRFMTSEPITL